jgi:hypothetical protein
LNKTSTFQLIHTLLYVCFSAEKYLGIFQYLLRGQRERQRLRSNESETEKERQTNKNLP